MVERLFILKSNDTNNQLRKGQSFNTDDEESLPSDSLQQVEDENSKTSISDFNLLKPDDFKRNLLSLHSPSMDSINDPDGSISDNQISEKIKKKKSRRTIDTTNSLDLRKSYSKKRPWYTKVDFTKPIIALAILFLIYLMWVKRDVWIPRLLTSNTRLRHTKIKFQEKINDKGDSSSTKNSSSLSSNEDYIDNDNQNKNNYNINNDQTSIEDNDEDLPTTSKPSAQKLNLRVRRNKISFSKERQTKKHGHSRNKIVDDEDEVIDDDNEVDDDNEDNDNDNIIKKLNKEKEVILPSSIHSSKKHHHHHHHHRSDQSHEEKMPIVTSSKTALILSSHDDIVEQLRKLVKSHGRNRDLLTIFTKETGLSKSKITRFLSGKDYSVITLDILISFLKSFHSTILIVPQ